MVEPSRTYHANQAVQLTELITIRFANESFGTSTQRLVHVAEPDGPSTDGGRKARQSIVLKPKYGDGPGIVVGWIDVSKATAELKGFSVLSQQHQARYHDIPDISRGEYDRFVHELMDFLKLQGLDTRLNNVPPERAASLSQPPKPAAIAPTSNRTILVAAALGVVIGFALGFLVFGLPVLL